jgi:hypothetical protein
MITTTNLSAGSGEAHTVLAEFAERGYVIGRDQYLRYTDLMGLPWPRVVKLCNRLEDLIMSRFRRNTGDELERPEKQ